MPENNVEKITSAKKLGELVKFSAATKKRMQSEAGTLGEKIADAVEKHHLHKGAFAVIARLHRMDELKRNDFIRSLDAYMDIMENTLWKDQGHTGDLAENAGDGDPETEETEDQKAAKANAEAIKAGIKETDPAKGDGRKKRTAADDKIVGFPSAPPSNQTH